MINIEHQQILKNYSLDMSTWTIRDVRKLGTAKMNGINLYLIYPKHTNYLLRDGKLIASEINDLWKM